MIAPQVSFTIRNIKMLLQPLIDIHIWVNVFIIILQYYGLY